MPRKPGLSTQIVEALEQMTAERDTYRATLIQLRDLERRIAWTKRITQECELLRAELLRRIE